MSPVGSWPRWSLDGEPAALAKYVLPDEVAALLHLPGPPADSRIGQTRAVYEALAGAGITYSHEAPSDDPGRQVVRQPGEVLWCPRHATCLDLSLILAGACLHAGLHPFVLILDPPESGRAAHALLGVWVDDVTSDDDDDIRMPDADVWTSRPDGFDDLVQTDPTGPSRPLLLLDPVGVAHALPHSPILGTGAAFADAVHAGARYAREWNWRLAVDIRRTWRKQDTHTPAGRPTDEPLRSPYVALDPLVHRPLQVLRAEHAVVPFQARDELTILTDWCRTVAAGPYTGVTVIHGAGGAGKTRLALELAHQLATRHGWYTGYLREHPTGRDWLGTVVSPTLIVLDYADARTADAEQLLALLKRRTDRGAAPAVVVMTARAVNGQWLTALSKAWNNDGHLVRMRDPLHLPPEHPAGAALFRRAARVFHHGPDDELDLDAADRAAPADWTTLDYILLALLAARSSDRLPTTREDLYEEVLTHERAYWAQTYKKNAGLGRDADAPLDVLNQAVASLTLRAPTTRKEINAALRAVEELSDDAPWRETIRTTLATCLQPGPGEPLVLRPDPIADHLALHELHDDEDLLPAVLNGLDGDPLLAALRQLNRAAAAAPDSATRMVQAWISAEADRWQPVLQVAAEQGGTALAALRQLIDDEPPAPWLADISRAIPFTTIGLPELGLHTDLRRLAVLRADATTQPADLAEQLQRTSHRQFAAGDRRAALASITEAVDHYRALAQADPAAHLPDLAGSLNNLSSCQSKTGDRQAALTSIIEAVDHYRALAQADPAAHLPDLALSLNNLSGCQSETGDRQAALTSVTEAVKIRRTLAQADPAAHLPDLAGSLNNLSGCQSKTGDGQAALTSIIEAVDHYRALAQADPAAHLPDLALSLNNLSGCQSKTGDRQAALTSVTEAVKIRRTLAQANPAAHLPDLAGSLNILSGCQSETGDRQAALTSIIEAVKIHRALAQADPAAHLPDLAMSLNNLSGCQRETGDRQAALTSIVEAVDHYRALAQADPAAYLPYLAMSLNNLSGCQSETGDRQAALTSITEAVKIHRALAQADPAARLPYLAMSLNNLSGCQRETGDRQAALTSIVEAVDHYRALAQADPAAYLPYLATSLNNLSGCQSETGDRQAALTSITEAVDIRRTLTQANPAAHLPDLAMSLNNLSNQQSETGDRQAALTSITEAVDHYRALTEANPAAYLPDLAGSLNNLSNRQSETGDRQAALTSITEAVDHYRALTEANPAAYLPDLAMSLNNLSNRQSETGDRQAALTSITEAVKIRRALTEANPAAHLPDLAMSLNNLSNRQSETGDRQAALTSITEAVKIRRALTEANPAAHLPDLAGSLNNLSGCQSETGDRQAALTSITEAVKIRRALTEANPAAYLPDLAGSLNNLSGCQSETGDRQAALTSITEAVKIRRALTQANPAAYLPDLAMSLKNLSNQQSEAEVASSAWEDSLADLEFSPLAQAELRSHYAAYLAAHVDASLAVEQLVRAAQACVAGDRSPLSRARQRVRGTATRLGIQDPQLPDWAVDPLPDDVLELLDQWASATDWPTTEAFLHAHADRLRQPDFRRGLELAAALFPESPDIDNLTEFLDQVEAEGLVVILDRGRHDNEVRQTLDAWLSTRTWTESKDFLDGHDSILRAPEVQALLAGADAPEARQHLAILQLTEGLSSDQVYEIVTDPDVATEHAFAAVDQADVPLMRRVVTAHPGLLTGITGAFFATVSAVAGGAADQARQLAQVIAEHGTDTQRRAYAIRLRALAGLPAALAGAGELADLIHPDKHS
ncbi:tetratricopeptide repeat protein [Streptomyces akebiae]|uniref:Tetratricopeptide repeat protein n=1 Tax=Streptomyces akebiae TaxID=2865673 RepID=A0ABX8XWG9_9ACTN|nr:tetratricopeptide repeat protein [Streptomyces akebiae]QYX80150.1 tetratricopeptide repeat protein [Streptomyces akebiae]